MFLWDLVKSLLANQPWLLWQSLWHLYSSRAVSGYCWIYLFISPKHCNTVIWHSTYLERDLSVFEGQKDFCSISYTSWQFDLMNFHLIKECTRMYDCNQWNVITSKQLWHWSFCLCISLHYTNLSCTLQQILQNYFERDLPFTVESIKLWTFTNWSQSSLQYIVRSQLTASNYYSSCKLDF